MSTRLVILYADLTQAHSPGPSHFDVLALTHSPSIAAQPIQTALLRVLGTTPSDPIAAEYRDRAASAALIARDASSMPRVPGGEEELQAVQIARKRLALEAKAGWDPCDRDGGGDDGKVYVDGRDVAAEWIFRYAVSGLKATDICD